MASVNKVILVGNLGADPETRYMGNGDAVCNIRLATTDSWKDKQSGEKREATEWHRVVFYRKLAEIAGQYLKKGGSVYIEGRLKTRKWQDKDGKDQYTTEIEATEMQMLGGRGQGAGDQGGYSGGGDSQGGYNQRPQGQGQGQRRPTPSNSGGGGFGPEGDDIPFAPYGRGIAGHAL